MLHDERQEITGNGGTKQYGATDNVPTYDANGDVVQNSYVSKVDIAKVDLAHTQKKETYQPGNNVIRIQTLLLRKLDT